jgi:hypothetical protein
LSFSSPMLYNVEGFCVASFAGCFLPGGLRAFLKPEEVRVWWGKF